ncbi:MAG: carboxymuconolactone decarboxylase family protein [Candidatus Thiodiazotropha sp. (ex Troendleina suluensis)]|nr:carboxymuconolactone decarboxylase family protein [Candidatus Thiodiazotropha sp. (ex Troendleina suluensis)]
MPRIHPVNPETTDAKTAVILQAVKKKLGVLPNIFTTFAQSPAALNSYVQLSECLVGGRLTARQREQIALAVAQENACQYCLSAHTVIGHGAGLSDDDIERARSGGASDSMDDLITQFALNVVRSHADISDQDLSAAKQGGLDEGLIIEIVANVTLNVMTNYLNKIAGTEIDFPVVNLKTAA